MECFYLIENGIVKKIFFVILILISTFSSCIRRELCYIRHDYEIVIVPKISYNYELSDDFIYFWADGEWGDIGYKKQDTFYEDIYINDEFVKSKLAFEDPVPVSSEDFVDCIISTYNLKDSDHTYILSTNKKDGKVFNFLTQYPIYEQPDEIWSSSIENMDCKIEGYNWELIDDEYYTRNVYTELKPQSFIYVIQIIIYNDKEDLPWREIQCDSLVLSGVSNTRNIRTQKSFDDKCNIIGEIKPGQDRLDKYVFCSRIVTFGIPSSYQDGSSWDISQNIECYIGFKIKLFNNIERRVKVNISNRIKSIPTGGLINIELNYSEIYTETENSGGIDVGVGGWNSDEINISI